jgi:hypothetical protein
VRPLFGTTFFSVSIFIFCIISTLITGLCRRPPHSEFLHLCEEFFVVVSRISQRDFQYHRVADFILFLFLRSCPSEVVEFFFFFFA